MRAAEASPADAPAETPRHGFAPSLSPDDFKSLFRGHPGGVTVITADAGGGAGAQAAASGSSMI